MRVLFKLSVLVCGFLGAVHTSLTFFQYGGPSPDAVWFAGTGVALMLLAVLNWAAWGSPHPSTGIRRVVLLFDVVAVAGGVIAVRAVHAPQALILASSFVGMLIGAAGLELRRRIGHVSDTR